MISVDELRAAGALEVPVAWRKSLHVERELLLFGDDEDDFTEEVNDVSETGTDD